MYFSLDVINLDLKMIVRGDKNMQNTLNHLLCANTLTHLLYANLALMICMAATLMEI